MSSRAMTMRSGMTVGEVAALFAATFPGLTLVFWDGSAAFYKEGGFPEYLVSDAVVVERRGDRPDVCVLSGEMTARQVRDAIYLPFGYEAEVEGLRDPGATLDGDPGGSAPDRGGHEPA